MIDFQNDKNLRRLIVGNIIVLVSAVITIVWNFSAIVVVVDRNVEDIQSLEENVRIYVQVTDNRVSSLESQQSSLYDKVTTLENLHLVPTPDGVENDSRNARNRPSPPARLRGVQRDQVKWPSRGSAR